MQPSEYIKQAINTEAPIDTNTIGRIYDTIRQQHALDGMTTEIGELADVFKKYKYYGKEIDWTNVEEEIGDLMWYIALMCDACGFSLEDIMQKNIDKLKARYPEKFTQELANNRNLDKEKDVLKKSYKRKKKETKKHSCCGGRCRNE